MQIVNENKLYKVIDRFFTSSSNLLGELIQNSARAGAKNIDITLGQKVARDIPERKTLVIKDDGRGIKDVKALLGIAFSDWDKVVENQEPAGLGFLQLIANSMFVTVKSKFGNMTIISPKFLNDPDYRQELISSFSETSLVDTEGTVIIAEMLGDVSCYHHCNFSSYAYFPQNITINNKPLEKINLDSYIQESVKSDLPYVLTQYKHNILFIGLNERWLRPVSPSCVNWYGQRIEFSISEINYNYINVFYDVQVGTPLCPKFPDRLSLKNNEAYKDFINFIKNKVCKLILDYFFNLESCLQNASYPRASLLKTFYTHCSNEQMNKMPYVVIDRGGAFEYEGVDNSELVCKSELEDMECCFTTKEMYINDEYCIGAEVPGTVFRIDPIYKPIFKNLGKKELERIELYETELDKNIYLNPLRLKFYYSDNCSEIKELPNALLCNNHHNFYVFGSNKEDIYQTFMEYYQDIMGSEDDPDSYDTQFSYFEDEFMGIYEKEFSVLNRYKFSFLPKSYDIKKIDFEDKCIKIQYRDDSETEMSLEFL